MAYRLYKYPYVLLNKGICSSNLVSLILILAHNPSNTINQYVLVIITDAVSAARIFQGKVARSG